MSTASLERAFSSTRKVIAGIQPEQLGAPTPCASWDVRALLNHVVAAPRVGATALATGEAVVPSEDFAGADIVAHYDATATMALEAFGTPGALEKVVTLPFGQVPASVLLTMVTTDQFVHGWDLARATGQPSDLDPGLAEELLGTTAIPDERRGEDGVAPFGPVREAPAGASAADRLAALLGRPV